MKNLLSRCLTGDAGILDLEAVAPSTVAALPDPLLLAYSAVMNDMLANDGVADAERILAKANGGAVELREIFLGLLDQAAKYEAGEVLPARPLLDAWGDLKKSPCEPVYAVDGLIETPSLVEVFGAAGTAKTLILLALLYAAFTFGTWAGRLVNARGPGIIFNGEGRRGLIRRIRALEIFHGKEIPGDKLFISSRTVAFDADGAKTAKEEIARVVAAAGCPPSFVVVDTLALHLDGDENSGADMGKFVRHMADLRDAYQTVVIILHHCGHKETDRSRGHSANRAALDTELRVSRQGAVRTMQVAKARDLPDDPRPTKFVLTPVEIGVGKDGKPVQSVVVEWAGASPASREVILTEMESLGARTLSAACAANGGFSAHLDMWRPRFYAGHCGDNEESKRKTFRRVRDILVVKGFVRVENDVYSIISTKYGVSLCGGT